MEKRLYRSRKNRIIAGVAGGIAEYLEVDPTIVRLIWIIAILSGVGIPLYIIAWILIPEDTGQETEYQVAANIPKGTQRSIGILLVILGVVLLLGQFIPWLARRILWPALLIVIGLWLIFGQKDEK